MVPLKRYGDTGIVTCDEEGKNLILIVMSQLRSKYMANMCKNDWINNGELVQATGAPNFYIREVVTVALSKERSQSVTRYS